MIQNNSADLSMAQLVRSIFTIFDGQQQNLHVNITDFDDLKFENYAEGILKGSKKNQGKRWTMDRDKCI